MPVTGKGGQINLAGLGEVKTWSTIAKYNYFVEKQESNLAKMRIKEKKNAYQSQLDQQIREKTRKDQERKEEFDSYKTAEKQLLQIHQSDEQKKAEFLKQRKDFEKQMRDLQRQEIEERKRFEIEKEKTMDAYILQKVQNEVKEEIAAQQKRKEEKKEMMKRMLVENEERKQIKLQQLERERLEDIELNKKAIKISENLEKERAAEFEVKANRINAMIKSSKNALIQKQNKEIDMEQKINRYTEVKNECVRRKQE